MIRRFRKKPVEIEAVQWQATNAAEMLRFLDSGGNVQATFDHERLTIHTLEGDMRADLGDYIIKGVKGEFYPCKPDIFEATYDPVDEEGAA